MALSTRRRSMGLRPRPFAGGNNLTRIRHCSSVTSLGYSTLVSIATAPSLECQNSRGRSFFFRFRQFQNAFLDLEAVSPLLDIAERNPDLAGDVESLREGITKHMLRIEDDMDADEQNTN